MPKAVSIRDFASRYNIPLTSITEYENFVTVKIPKGLDTQNYSRFLSKDLEVEYVEPNYIAYAFNVPNDPYYRYQWHLDNPVFGGVSAEEAWDLANGEGVVVAVVDTGVAYENYTQSRSRRYEKAPDLAGTCFVQGYDFVNKDTHPNDDSGHGTHITGTIAQTTDNNLGVAGLAYKSCIMPVKVLGADGSGTYANVAAGIRYAVDKGAKVINLSLGGPSSSQTLLDAVKYAAEKGSLVVAAAGNEAKETLSYPAAYNDYVVAVGATRYDETLAFYSSYGEGLDLVAPGGDLNVDQNADGYKDGILQQTFGSNPRDWGYYFYQGTSMATPHVSATAALLASKGVSDISQIKNFLYQSAQDLGTSGYDKYFGWGLLDTRKALELAMGNSGLTPTPIPNPTQTPTPTPTPTPTLTPTPTPTPTPTEKPWWCRYFPTHPSCQ